MLASAGRHASLRYRPQIDGQLIKLPFRLRVCPSAPRPVSGGPSKHGGPQHLSQFAPVKDRTTPTASAQCRRKSTSSVSDRKRGLVLNAKQTKEAAIFGKVGAELKKTWLKMSPGGDDSASFVQVLSASGLKTEHAEPAVQRAITRLEQLYVEQPHREVARDLDLLLNHLRSSKPMRPRPLVHQILIRIGVVEGALLGRRQRPRDSALVRRVSAGSTPLPASKASAKVAGSGTVVVESPAPSQKVASVEDFKLNPISVDTSDVPRLSFDLSRALFNPGVYQLQDPRSRVWNFDPYLGRIMPVSEFNFDALNKYITSSEDEDLRRVATQQGTRYTGSSSSLSGILCHFHFLLSAFRPLTMDNISRGFGEDHRSFTRLQRGPNAIFLRWQDGTYAVDADKEYDSANILMSLGRSMEKLLTLEKTDFEQYRKKRDESPARSGSHSQEREAYHYTQLGDFLLRSQLDCYDPRLPGTGVFDLKTRAVAGIRMMLNNHEEGLGYQIKGRYGTWESYEREYYDMMRAAFLKYSMQVRMGRMDGIFVAYHNVERLFGFQYVSLPEMDLALHGQTDKSLGDREFRLSFKLLTDIFNQATAAFPQTSIRFHFEAREGSKVTPCHMYIFAEPVSEEEITSIQTAKQSEIAAYEQRLFNPQPAGQALSTQTTNDERHSPGSMLGLGEDARLFEEMIGVSRIEEARSGAKSLASSKDSDAAEVPEDGPLLAWKLATRNLVNDESVERPVGLRNADKWEVAYDLTPFSEAMGRRHYTLCKNRRRAALDFPQSEDEAAGYYIRKLISLSRGGKEWRRQLDEFDSQRKQVVLYGQ